MKFDYPEGATPFQATLLRQGLWGVAELVHTSSGVAIQSFKPMQATVNLDLFKKARAEFSLSEWIDILLLSIGYDPASFSESEQHKAILYGHRGNRGTWPLND